MDITVQLRRLERGDLKVLNDVVPLVYDELKKLARCHLRREWGLRPIDTTVLVHEAYLKLAGGRHPLYENRAHFFGIASRLMRQILVDSARARTADKRDVTKQVPLAELSDLGPAPDKQLLAMDDALRLLETTEPLKAQFLEMRYFGGMTAEETAEALSKSVHLVRRELRLAHAWLRKEMTGTS